MKFEIWETGDGKKIPVAEMSDDHVINAYRCLDRRCCRNHEVSAFYLSPVFGPRGEMAQDAAEQEMMQIRGEQPEISGWLKAFKAEIVRRGLELPERSSPRPLPKVKKAEQVLDSDGRKIGTIYELEENKNRKQTCKPDFDTDDLPF